ncbi:hypothetical protein PtA15_14A401 [Puccinia triticina]|uniref:Uncharacterized protein n=1 Tax=Puccinia triticina TaxID=208348 RepID=A0ABY7D5G4_9BASI|nr:uncharacterized protein PtA15_14A401 [Puccinia triticina]WAQ91517.1 hypothetical protein PtA15_14A401 [Puccinia triticina]
MILVFPDGVLVSEQRRGRLRFSRSGSLWGMGREGALTATDRLGAGRPRLATQFRRQPRPAYLQSQPVSIAFARPLASIPSPSVHPSGGTRGQPSSRAISPIDRRMLSAQRRDEPIPHRPVCTMHVPAVGAPGNTQPSTSVPGQEAHESGSGAWPARDSWPWAASRSCDTVPDGLERMHKLAGEWCAQEPGPPRLALPGPPFDEHARACLPCPAVRLRQKPRGPAPTPVFLACFRAPPAPRKATGLWSGMAGGPSGRAGARTRPGGSSAPAGLGLRKRSSRGRLGTVAVSLERPDLCLSSLPPASALRRIDGAVKVSIGQTYCNVACIHIEINTPLQLILCNSSVFTYELEPNP